ncbi:metallophosphoesterase [Mucilaginibacter sp. BJC16-A38]|uniref:metallophosphoesterase n=1 Tax=Mucilaginibacter phenanthrenivorans TaxID=1234842 RepID=UPI0021574CF4|nr:metallophosphoesterase [Mucilaginibacter phenanthrenivorans]MCR8560755.1 metallophosphoesterase [Mucilaginibacter phenanthrenivorans]
MHNGGFIKVFLVMAVISLLLDWYVFNGIKTITNGWQSGLARNLVNWGYLGISVGITVVFIAGFGAFSTARGMTPFHEWMLSLFLTFLITKIFFVLVLFLGDITRFFYGIISHLFGSKTNVAESYFPARRKFVSELAVLVAAVPFSGFMYAMFKGKYDYKVHRTTLYFDDLPEAFDGFTITQLSDIHSGSFDDTKAMQRGIDLAKAQKSDLFVFTGDLVNNAAWEIEPYISNFSQLRAPFGQFSILGNHDYGDYIEWASEAEKAANLDKLKEHHKTLGYRLMLDENIDLEKNGQKISLIGVQNWGRGFIQLGDLDKALKGVDKDAFKILLSHDPTHWEEKVRFNPTTVHLTLAGHTHGAQFGVEVAGFRWSPVQYRYLDWAGLVNEKNRYLYVNRGFGFLAFSGRLGIWPEITVITLKKKRSEA